MALFTPGLGVSACSVHVVTCDRAASPSEAVTAADLSLPPALVSSVRWKYHLRRQHRLETGHTTQPHEGTMAF